MKNSKTALNMLGVSSPVKQDEEIRDISISKLKNNIWSDPITINEDNWKIYGCPVNGPSIDSNGEFVAIAWFTLSNGEPSINLKF